MAVGNNLTLDRLRCGGKQTSGRKISGMFQHLTVLCYATPKLPLTAQFTERQLIPPFHNLSASSSLLCTTKTRYTRLVAFLFLLK